MHIEPAALATSSGTLTTLGVSDGLPEALQQVVDAAKLLFEADGAGPMLVGRGELLTWESASDARAESAEAVQAEPRPALAWLPGASEAGGDLGYGAG